MNRWDEIYARALDCAGATGLDDAEGRRRAADLIKLIGLMVDGVGKVVASDGESDMNACAEHGEDEPGEYLGAHTRYLVGERMQEAAVSAVADTLEADLKRYEKGGRFGTVVWRPRCTGCGKRVGMSAPSEYTNGERVQRFVQHDDGCPTLALFGCSIECGDGEHVHGCPVGPSACGDCGLYNGYHMDTCTVPDRDGMPVCGLPSFAPSATGGERCRLQSGHPDRSRHEDGTTSWLDSFINPTDPEFCHSFDGIAAHRARWRWAAPLCATVCRICGRKKPGGSSG